MKYILCMLTVVGLCSQTLATGKVISVTEFGVEPDSRANAVKGVQAAIEACRKEASATLVFPKGRYDFWPQHAEERVYYESNSYDNNPKTCAILIENVEGLTIDGSGSAFVFHGRIQPFTVERSERVTIENLTIDWDIPAPDKAPEPFHRNIRIEENVFHAFDYPVLYAKSVDGLTLSNNRIVRSTRYEPYHRRRHMLNLEYCRDVTVAGNRLESDVLGRDVFVENMDPAEVTIGSGQGISGTWGD